MASDRESLTGTRPTSHRRTQAVHHSVHPGSVAAVARASGLGWASSAVVARASLWASVSLAVVARALPVATEP